MSPTTESPQAAFRFDLEAFRFRCYENRYAVVSQERVDPVDESLYGDTHVQVDDVRSVRTRRPPRGDDGSLDAYRYGCAHCLRRHSVTRRGFVRTL